MDALVLFAQETGAGSGFVVFWLVSFAAYIWGVARLFMGNHTTMAWVAIFVPLVFLGGFFMLPRPGSSRFSKLDDVKKAEAESRFPVQAAALRALMRDLDA